MAQCVCVKAIFSLLDFQVLSGLAHDHVTATAVQIKQNICLCCWPGRMCTPEAALLDGLWVRNTQMDHRRIVE